MKILHIIHSLRKGGAERVLLELCLSQINNGDTPKILSLYGRNDYKENKYSNVEVMNIVSDDSRYLFSLKTFARGISHELIAHKYHAIIIHSRSAIVPLLITNINTPLIYIIQGNHYASPYVSLSNSVYYLLERLVVKVKNLHIVVPNYAMLDPVIDTYRMNKGNVHCIANGVDTDFFSFRKNKPNPNTVYKIAVIGTLHQGKNVNLSIDAFQELLRFKDNVSLLIVGEGAEARNIVNLISKYGLQDKISMMGEVNNIHELYHEIDLLWSFSSSEGLPTVLLESMASGVPVVASNVIGNKDIIEHGVNGFLFELDNVGDAAQYSAELFNDEKARERVIFSARKIIESNFSIKSMRAQYHQLISEVTNN
jgi:glycosyltransferase involved in cell wall biosynthesis